MVYPFALPTTSHLAFQALLSSSTHPSLPQSASTARYALRLALKAHKRLPRPQQDTHLSTLLTTLNDYLPYLATISHGLSGKPIEPAPGSSEEVEIVLRSELETDWRPTLSSSSTPLKLPQQTSRARGRGLDFELAFVLSTLAYVLSRLARASAARTFYAASTPTPDQRTAAAQSACRSLLQASAVHSLLASSPAFADVARAPGPAGATTSVVPDLDPAAQAALSSLALAEATLLAVWKDDAHIAACIQARNPNDREWMVRAPEIPKVRALLFARLCVRAAEYAEQAAAGLGAVAGGGTGSGIADDLVKYSRVLGRVARARACRFFGVDAEAAGKVGEAIAWLRAARGVLGLRGSGAGENEEATATSTTGARAGLSKLKKGWMERREERKMEKDAGGRGREKSEFGPGDDATREEEGRVVDTLEAKWAKMNDTVSRCSLDWCFSLVLSADCPGKHPTNSAIHKSPGEPAVRS